MRRSPVAVAAALALLLAGTLAVAGGAAAAQEEDHVAPCAAEPPDDFGPPAGGDAIGYVPAESIGDGNGTDTESGNESEARNETASGNETTSGNGSESETESESGTESKRGSGTAGGIQTGSTVLAGDLASGVASTASVAGPEYAAIAGSAPGSESTAAGSQDGTDSDDGPWLGSGDGGDPAQESDEGTWYDEPLEVDHSDGLSERELDATVARTAARVEALRCRSFERVPPVRVINRTQLERVQVRTLYDRSRAARQFDDERLEAAMLVDDDRNATEVRVATRTAAVLAYYDPVTDEIVLVAENESAPRIDETTLGHELVHALQDQHFDLGSLDSDQVDPALAETGLIEGDARLVETRYRRNCGGSWTGGCLSADAPDADTDASLGLQLLLTQPYNDGPRFVQHVYDDGGWAAVDRLYERPPNTTLHLMDPPTYDTFSPTTVPIDRTRASADWEPLRPPDGPPVDVLGPATIGTTLMAPTLESDVENVYSTDRIRRSGGGADVGGPYRYRLDAVTGWQGDRFAVYVDDRNRTASIWRSEWATTEDAATFRDRYLEVVSVRGGSAVTDAVYRFSRESDQEGAVYAATEGDEVVVVHAPDVNALEAVYPNASTDALEGSGPDGPSVPDDSSRDGTGSEANGTDDALSLPGVAVAAVALLVGAGVLGARSRRR